MNYPILYNEDCMIGMQRLSDKSIDMICCDLPYFKVVKDDFDNQWDSEEDYLQWLDQMFIQYKRVLKDNGNIFLFTSRQLNRKVCNLLDKHFNEQRIIIWARKRGFNNTRGKALASGYEPICFYRNGDKGTFNTIKIKPNVKRPEYDTGILKDGITLSDVWDDIPALPHNAKEKVDHPTQKPIALIERILLIGSNEGDVILDNCMGSGTTGVACTNTNRNFIGFEVDKTYFDIANERINKK